VSGEEFSAGNNEDYNWTRSLNVHFLGNKENLKSREESCGKLKLNIITSFN
jgi:hypothetical protein